VTPTFTPLDLADLGVNRATVLSVMEPFVARRLTPVDPLWTAVIALFGILALAASVYLVEVLEILKLRQTRLRQLITLRRTAGAPEPNLGDVNAAVEQELETGTFPTVDPETGEFEAIK